MQLIHHVNEINFTFSFKLIMMRTFHFTDEGTSRQTPPSVALNTVEISTPLPSGVSPDDLKVSELDYKDKQLIKKLEKEFEEKIKKKQKLEEIESKVKKSDAAEPSKDKRKISDKIIKPQPVAKKYEPKLQSVGITNFISICIWYSYLFYCS